MIFANNDSETLDKRIGKIFRQYYKNEKKFPMVGFDQVDKGDIQKVFPKHEGVKHILKPEYYNDLRNWLLEPRILESERRPIILDTKQEKIVQEDIITKSKSRRIKGPAGTGKTLVLACKAARLMAQGKSVLVVSYNITLTHFIRKLVYRALETREGGAVSF